MITILNQNSLHFRQNLLYWTRFSVNIPGCRRPARSQDALRPPTGSSDRCVPPCSISTSARERPRTSRRVRDGSLTLAILSVRSNGPGGSEPVGGRMGGVRMWVGHGKMCPMSDEVEIGGPAAGSLTHDKTPTFSFNSTEPGSTFQCRFDAKRFAACTSPLTSKPLTNGAHKFNVKAIDAAGNESAVKSRSFRVG